MAAAALAIVVYYAHFMDTYRSEFARIGHETATAAVDAGGRTIGQRLRSVPYYLQIFVGTPVLLLAALGAVRMSVRPAADRLALALTGWTLSCAAFLALGVLTPVDMRYYLAAIPAIAIAAGCGAAWAWTEGPSPYPAAWRIVIAILLAAAVSTASRNWWNTLG
jgi:hypothetical protein